MKNLLFLGLLLVFSKGISQEWGSLNKNELILKEIAPIWPGCESKKGTDANDCFKQQLIKHVGKNFRYPPEAYKKNEQGIVTVEFMVNEQGKVEIVSVTGGTPALQEEAKRNILLIPKMAKPGMYGGKPKALLYTVPFNYKTGK
jgi:periplasmic protein TonB